MSEQVAVARDAVAVAAEVLGPVARRDQPLGPMTTYRVGGAAALLVQPRTIAELALVGTAHVASGLPLLVVGRGSNLLVADAGFAGIAVSVALLASDIDLPSPSSPSAGASGSVSVRAGGAVALPTLARRTAAAGVTGFEWAVGVPGSIGGGVRMNAGGHGSDMAACIEDVEIMNLTVPAPTVETWPVERLQLRFRGSDLGDGQVVVAARLGLHRGDRARAEATISEIVRWRREHQPGGQNAGSVFVNPVPGEISAGLLVDELGLRGLRIGTAAVSEKHANFIQADEGGRAEDVRAVMEAVRRRVAEEKGFLLRSEVRLVGFDEVAT